MGNSKPVVSNVVLGPPTAFVDSVFSATVQNSDEDGQAVTVNFEWHVIKANGAEFIIENESISTLTNNNYFVKGDTVYVVATPSDGVEEGLAVTSNNIQIQNSAPTQPVVTVTIGYTDASEAEIDALTCRIDASSSDADGDLVTYSYTWTTVNAGATEQVTQNTNSTSDSLMGMNTYDDTWVCTVTKRWRG